MSEVRQAQILFEKFLAFHKQDKIPPKMAQKLLFLSQAFIDKKHQYNSHQKQQLSISPEQRNSLSEMPYSTKIKMFNQIVECLISELQSQEYIIQNENCFIRKNISDSVWVSCKISLSKKKLVLINSKTKEIIKQFMMKSIELISRSQAVEKIQRKYQISFLYHENNIFFGFSSKKAAVSILKTLIKHSPQRQQQELTKQEESNSQTRNFQQKTIKAQIPFPSDKEQSVQALPPPLNQQIINEARFAIQFIQEFKNQYRLVKTIQKGRILVNSQVAKCKTSILIQNIEAQDILESYFKLKEWCMSIQDFCILSKVSQNSFLTQTIFKKTSNFMIQYFESSKQSINIVSVFKVQNSYYLMFRPAVVGCENNQVVKNYNAKNSSSCFSQVLEITQKIISSQKVCLINIYTQFQQSQQGKKLSYSKNNNYYDSNQQKQKKPIKNQKDQKWLLNYVLTSHTNLYSYFLTQSKPTKTIFSNIPFIQLKQIHQEDTITFYSFVPGQNFQVQNQNQIYYDLQSQHSSSFRSQKDEKQTSNEIPQKTYTESIAQSQSEKSKQLQFVNNVLKQYKGKPTEKLLQLLKESQNQKYYFKRRFNQVPQIDLKKLEYQETGENDFFLQNGRFKMTQNNEVYFADEEAIKAQKDVIYYFIKKAGSAIFSGESVMNMPMPVQISEPRSMTERVSIGLGPFPKYMTQAAQMNSPIDQLKKTIEMVLAMTVLFINVEKPFNPILGQTLQVNIAGIPVYFEQISHHPPITSFFTKTQTFQFHGNFVSHLSLGLNTALGKNLSLLKLKFYNTQTQFLIRLVDIQAAGLAYGDRKIRPFGMAYVVELQKKLLAQFSVGKIQSKKPYISKSKKVEYNEVVGGIYRVDEVFIKKFKAAKCKNKFEGIKDNNVVETLGKIHGQWLNDIFIDDVLVRSRYSPMPNQIQLQNCCLPSDSNFRLDVLLRRLKMNKEANIEKERLEILQRRDKKLRQGKIKIN